MLCADYAWEMSIIWKHNAGMPTFIRAVSKRAGSTHAAWTLLQRCGAPAQSVSLPIELEWILCWDTVRATHTGAREIKLGHICGTHCSEHKHQNIADKFKMYIFKLWRVVTYAGLSSGICRRWCQLCPVAKEDFRCPADRQWSGSVTIPFLPRVMSVWRRGGTWRWGNKPLEYTVAQCTACQNQRKKQCIETYSICGCDGVLKWFV